MSVMESTLIQMSLFDFDVIETIGTQEDRESQNIETTLLDGSGFQNGKTRIRDYGLTNPTISDFAKMIKAEYGIGGRSSIGPDIHNEMHDGGGIEFRWLNDGEWIETEVTWTKAAQVISQLIKDGRYKF